MRSILTDKTLRFDGFLSVRSILTDKTLRFDGFLSVRSILTDKTLRFGVFLSVRFILTDKTLRGARFLSVRSILMRNCVLHCIQIGVAIIQYLLNRKIPTKQLVIALLHYYQKGPWLLPAVALHFIISPITL